MKKSPFLILLSILLTINVNAQTPPAKTWYENQNGQKTTVNERWEEDGNGLKNGKYIKYDYSYFGNIYHVASVGNYLHEKKQGEWKNFYSNGDICDIGNYSNDLKIGKWKESYDQQYKIYQEGYYTNDLREGEWINTDGENLLMPSTKKGFKTIYKKGIPTNVFNQTGEDILLLHQQEKEKQERLQLEHQQQSKLKQQQEDDFKKAMDKYYDKYSRKYYGDTTDLHTFLIKYPHVNPDYINEAKQCIKNKPDNDAFYQIKSIEDFFDYDKNFPNGIHIKDVQKYLKDYTISNEQTLREDVVKDLNQANVNDAIIGCELLLRYKGEFDEVHNQLTVIYYSLALWSKNDTKAIEVVKPYMNTVIHFSDGDVKFKSRYWSYYKTYKTILKLDNKEIYTTIKAL